MTTVTNGPISRVSCWRRKLSRHFEVQLHWRHEILGKGILRGGDSFDSNSLMGKILCTKIEL
jgi:hypothetical protein